MGWLLMTEASANTEANECMDSTPYDFGGRIAPFNL